jgi:chromosome segregation ATPase
MTTLEEIKRLLAPNMGALLAQDEERAAAERADLREKISQLDAEHLPVARAMDEEIKALDDKLRALKTELETVEKAHRAATFDHYVVRSGYTEQREKLAVGLLSIPAKELVAFREEIAQRIGNARNHLRTWPSKKRDAASGLYPMVGNQDTVDRYVNALMHSRGMIDLAVRKGLDGDDALKFAAEQRASWPQVQVGPEEFVSLA